MRRMVLVIGALVLLTAVLLLPGRTGNAVVVGSKNFPESYILGEIMAQLLEDRGLQVERRFGLGGTLIGFEALRIGGIDVYAEYSGTLEQAILKSPGRVAYAELQDTIRREYAMDFLEPFGFNNTYAIALSRSEAARRGLKTIGDLAKYPNLRYGFTHDFLSRHDGWAGLARTYGLTAEPSGIEHGLSYPAIRDDKLDVTDAYATDGDIDKFDLVLLEDDRQYFPKYWAAPLMRADVAGRIKTILNELAGRITDAEMTALNARVSEQGQKAQFAEVARDFLRSKELLLANISDASQSKWAALRSRVIR